MKKNLDEVLREKCRKVDINYDFKLEEKSKLNYSFIFKFVAIFSILVVLSACFYVINTKSELLEANKYNTYDKSANYEDKNEKIDNTQLSQNNISKNITETIEFGNEMNSLAFKMEPELIVAVKIDKLVQTTNYINKTDEYSSVPISIFSSTPIKVFKGSKLSSLTFYNWGGVISLAEYEKSLLPVQIEKRGLKSKTQEEKESIYIEFVSSLTLGVPKIEVGKTYLLLLKYDKEYFDMYNTIIKGVYEYDETNDKIKDILAGEWIDIDLNQLLDY